MIFTLRKSTYVSNIYCGISMMLSVFVLAGCSSESEAPHAEISTVKSADTGILETSKGSYMFTPSTCAMYNSDGIDDIEIQGPGTAPDGSKFFFELSSIANALTIGLGVDRPFANPERQLKAGRAVSQEFTIVASDQKILISNLVLVDENFKPFDDNATIKIDCGS